MNMIRKHPLLIVLLSLFFPIIITSQVNSSECQNSCGSNYLPYPFGFSSGCEIELNCTQSGRIFIGEFPVQSVNSEGIIVNIEGQCNRSFETFNQLFSNNYAPTSGNTIILENCTHNFESCSIPVSSVTFDVGCNSGGSVTCYSENNEGYFMNATNLDKIGCKYFMSSISNENVENAMHAARIELGWWLLGDQCRCSYHADCTEFNTPIDDKPGFRCNCPDRYTGDGFLAGTGCRKGKQLSLQGKVIIGVGSAAMAILLMCITLCYFRGKSLVQHVNFRFTTKNDKNVEAFLKDHGALLQKRYKFSEIKKMTNSFKIKLGQGGFGAVYKGKLFNGCFVAVKILNASTGNSEEFINEVASISRTSHVNIVTLLGFCFEGNKKALIYELMANGSLDNFIYKKGPQNIASLSWEKLYEIAKGIAQGLDYLHRGCNTRILHFDIKPHNILLDENFCPKISDFGLAKLCPKRESIISMSNARGTIGYIAPEVWNRQFGGVSQKSDIYSYGMMILEMVGVRKNIDADGNQTSEYFPDWIYNKLEKDNDLRIDGVVPTEEDEIAKGMTIVGLWCIQTFPNDRPTISKVIEMLDGDIKSLQIPPKPMLSSSPKLSSPTRSVIGSSTT